MTYTINDDQSMSLVVDDEGEVDTKLTTARRVVIMKNGQILPTKSIFPEVENLVIIENLVQGTFQFKLEMITGALILDELCSFDSLDAAATYIANKVSRTLPTTYTLDDYTKMVMCELPNLIRRFWVAFFIKDGQVVPASFILPGIEAVVAMEDSGNTLVRIMYTDGTDALVPDSFESLTQATTYIIHWAMQALMKSK